MAKGKGLHFGGDWTEEKLDVLAKYLAAYTTALKEQPSKLNPFKKAYIDAFAGTGYREAKTEEASNEREGDLLFPDLATGEPQGLLEGSARLALKTNPPFDRYIFIEKRNALCEQLEGLKQEFPAFAESIDIRPGDANEEIQKICHRDWSSHRAVLFLDPFGMQVEWTTIEAIASTKAIDLWVLFPLGIGVNRLLKKDRNIPPSWIRRLNLLLGTEEWYEKFYRIEKNFDIFGTPEERVIKATTETIGKYFVDRLQGIFAGVAKEPRILRNRMNSPLYLLCFAVGNPKGAPIALKIANHILKKV